MKVQRQNSVRAARRGVVLLVVLALLTLFAAVGVAFVAFSEQEGNAAANGLTGRETRRPEADLLFGYFLNQVVFDSTNSLSAMQTHGLATNMYGPSGYTAFNGIGRRHTTADPILNYGSMTPPDAYYFPNFQGLFDTATGPQQRLFSELIHGTLNAPYTYPDWNSHYLGAMDSNGRVLARSFVRPGPGGFNPYDANNAAFWGPNVPNLMLSSIGAGLNQVRAMVMRPIPWDTPRNAQLMGGNPLCARCAQDANGNPLFPPPADLGGDVKNLPPGTIVMVPNGANPPIPFAGNDSYWVDLGFPNQIGADGKAYRPLFAFYIMDLDGKVNINAHGNIRAINPNGPGGLHASNRGHGPWEVNPAKVLLDPFGNQTGELPALFVGTGSAQPAPFMIPGRYGVGAVTDKTSTTDAIAPPGFTPPLPRLAPLYSRMDYSSTTDPSFGPPPAYSLSGTLGTYVVPGENATLGYDRQPRFWLQDPSMSPLPAAQSLGYPRNAGEHGEEFQFHPMAFNPLNPSAPGAQNSVGNRVFPDSNMEALLRHGDTGTDALVSDVRRLLPNSLNTPNVRRVLTTRSFDLDRPGVIPWNYWSAAGSAFLQMVTANPLNLQGGPLPFPPTPPPTFPLPPSYTEFTPNWRSAYAALGRIDLNRPLPDYPLPDPTTGRLDLTNPNTKAQFTIAQTARQALAADIYLVLVRASGAYDPMSTTPPPVGANQQQIVDGLRWLAQLSANIVDYIDDDDYNTPFNWGGSAAVGSGTFIGPGTNYDPAQNGYTDGIVYGTELPRLVLNEVYLERRNRSGTSYDANFWIEFYNPLREDPALRPEYNGGQGIFAGPGGTGVNDVPSTAENQPQAPAPGFPVARGGAARLQFGTAAAGGYAGYRVYLTQHNANLRLANNAYGDPDGYPQNLNNLLPTRLNNANVGSGTGKAILTDWNLYNAAAVANQTNWVYAGDNFFEGVNGWNYGFYLLGPQDDTGNNVIVPGPNNNTLVNTLSRPEMQVNNDQQVPNGNVMTVMLRRLACPHLRPNDPRNPADLPPYDATLPLNPYITVDYIEDVNPNANNTDSSGNNANTGSPPPPRKSIGKTQPHQNNGAIGYTQQPYNSTTLALDKNNVWTTFFMINQDSVRQLAAGTIPPALPNSPNTLPGRPPFFPNPSQFSPAYDWLVHLDREVISPMELLHTSNYKPHELMQQFIAPPDPAQPATNITKFAHTMISQSINGNRTYVLPWFDQNLRLYRAFEFLQARSRVSGVANITLQAANITTQASPPYPPSTYRVFLNPNILLDPILSKTLGLPAGVTPGDGAVWGIQPGNTVMVGGQIGIVLQPNNNYPSPVVGGGNGQNPPPPYPYFDVGLPAAPNGNDVLFPFYGGRQPGKININTVWDKEVFRSLIDVQGANSFATTFQSLPAPYNTTPDGYADFLFDNIKAHDPLQTPTGGPNFVRPFASFGIGYDAPGTDQQWPAGLGINNTLLLTSIAGNTAANQARYFEVPPTQAGPLHPYRKYELLTKIFNNVTVRSNTFAVWCTVGYFQVDSAGRLGAEIQRADGRQTRNRFFAIVDRSVLDPWVQSMNAILAAQCSNNDWLAQYDVLTGVNFVLKPGAANPPGPKPPVPPSLILPILGNASFDPRKDYASVPNSLGLPSGPPPSVVYWSVIQ